MNKTVAEKRLDYLKTVEELEDKEKSTIINELDSILKSKHFQNFLSDELIIEGIVIITFSDLSENIDKNYFHKYVKNNISSWYDDNGIEVSVYESVFIPSVFERDTKDIIFKIDENSMLGAPVRRVYQKKVF